MTILKMLVCWFCGHDWTSKASEGIPPSEDERPRDGDTTLETMAKFWKYATMSCRRCGKVYEP